jgi:putative membrane protein insertion efficiency factor
MGDDRAQPVKLRWEDAKSHGARALLLLVRFYIVFLSPFFGGACKFYPSCSNYAAEAIARHGARRGFALAMKRLLRCHPFTRGGVDFVPDLAAEPTTYNTDPAPDSNLLQRGPTT